jgi:hypothetical protein
MYGRIFRTYYERAPSLLALGAVVFIPLGLLDSLVLQLDAGSGIEGGFALAGLVAFALAQSGTSLIGEVFYSGAVAISLTQSEDGRAPSMREVARRIAYRRLIVVDLLFALICFLGFLALILPGFIFFIWFGLAGPVVEIEGRRVRAAFRRSRELVRGRFWRVLAVLLPVEIVGDGLSNGLTAVVHHALGGSVLGGWIADSAANILVTPLYAIGAVLLTVQLIAEKDAAGADSPAPS